MISRDVSFFSKGGCKCTPLLQQELDIVAFRPPLEMHLQGQVTAPPAPENRAPCQGRLVPSAVPGNATCFQGRLVAPAAPGKHNKYLGAHHLPPPDRTVLSRGRCCPNFSCIINRGEVLNTISLKLEALGGK